MEMKKTQINQHSGEPKENAFVSITKASGLAEYVDHLAWFTLGVQKLKHAQICRCGHRYLWQ
jgi:hypothetical protein